MPVGTVAGEIAASMGDQLRADRQQQRDTEDANLSYQQELIHGLISQPNANPNAIGQALHDMLDLQNAKGGKGKPAKAGAGFLGAHELPISQFLQGIQSAAAGPGPRALVGPTTTTTPAPQAPVPTASGVGSG